MGRRLQFKAIFVFIFLFVYGLIPNQILFCQQNNITDHLTTFTAKIKDKKVYLIWKITNLKTITHFQVERSDSKNEAFINILPDKKISSNKSIEETKDELGNIISKFEFDEELERDGIYFYRLKAISLKNELVFKSDDIKLGVTGIKDFILDQNTPNPFNPSTRISYELFNDTYVKLQIFDLIGKEIDVLVDQQQLKGKYTIEFNASKYEDLTTGIYFYKLQTDKYSDVKKMILSK